MVKVIAHRGCGVGPFENTLRAMQWAISVGVDGVEFDVRSSSDGEPVVIHDYSLNRITNGTGLVAEHSLNELKKLDIGEGEQIPTLIELIDFVKDFTNLLLFIEIKVTDLEARVLEEVQRQGVLDRAVIQSFIPPVLKSVRELNSDIATALLYEYDLSNPVSKALDLGCTGLHPKLNFVTQDLALECQETGLQLVPWSVNSEEDARRLVKFGVDGLITDKPLRLHKFLKG